MAIEFLSHVTGFVALLGADSWLTDDHYAVLVDTAGTPNRDTWDTLANVTNECTDANYIRKDITGETFAEDTVDATKIKASCAKIDFGTAVTISSRYLLILKGTVAAAASTDTIVGHIDLSGSANVSSVAAEFSYTPGANGLFRISQSIAE
jgi:hypothetical protein